MKRLTAFVLAGIMCLSLLSIGGWTDNSGAGSGDSPEIVSISAGTTMSAAVLSDGTLWTWGCGNLYRQVGGYGWSTWIDNRLESLGLAAGSFKEGTPMMVFSNSVNSAVCSTYYGDTNFAPSSSQFALAPMTAVLRDDNSLWVWGSNGKGALGTGDIAYSWTPVKILEDVVSYDVSGHHSAAVTADGSLYMWGANTYGQLGDGSTEDKYAPVKVMEDAAAVSLGEYFTVALKTDGTVWTWGRNLYGQLGDGSTEARLTPVKVLEGANAIAAGGCHACAVKTDGSLWMWGYNSSGQLGNGSTSNVLKPTRNGDMENVAAVSLGDNYSAAIDTDGILWMWGDNSYGKLGNNTTNRQTEPIIIMRGVRDVSLGQTHTLALSADGTLYAWGNNAGGQLGNFSTTTSYAPVPVQLGSIQVNFNVEGTAKKMTISWSDQYLYDDCSAFNNDLAIGGIIMSADVYDAPSRIAEFGYKVAVNSTTNAVDKPPYVVGYRATYDFDDPHVEIAMAIRGTSNISNINDVLTDLKGFNDAFDGPASYCYSGLQEAKNSIVNALNKNGITVTKSNTKYFITGHSLGGACAGKMALKMANDGFARTNNLYVYTFAAPNYTGSAFGKNLDSVVDVPGIFDIVNSLDMVPDVPSFMMYNMLIPINLYHGGHLREYTPNASGRKFVSAITSLYGEFPWDTLTPLKSHMTQTYLALLLADESWRELLATVNHLVVAHCPVDVEVYDEAGDLCGYTENGVAYNMGNSSVLIMVHDDAKYIGFPDGNMYTIRYIGTDSGAMDIEESIYSSETSSAVSQQEYVNIALEEGKTLESSVGAKDGSAAFDLYVTDDEGDRVSTVSENGAETLLAKYTLTSDMIEFGEGQSFLYTGESITPEVAVAGLEKGEDYRLIYDNNVNVGHATVTVKGINEYSGRFTYGFDITAQGKCTDNMDWTLDSDGVLTISGIGALDTSGWNESQWWYSNRDRVTSAVIESGVTEIGAQAFCNHAGLTEVHLPESITAVGDNAFSGCSALENVYYGGFSAQWDEIAIGDGNEPLTNASLNCTVSEHDHIWGDWIISREPSCTEAGERYRICNVCRAKETDVLDTIAHTWGDWIIVTNATEETPGMKERTCGKCGEKDERIIPRIGSGDINGDGTLDKTDILLLAAYINGISADIEMTAADMDADGAVSYNDLLSLIEAVNGVVSPTIAAAFMQEGFDYEAALVLRYCVGLIDKFPDEISISVPDLAPAIDSASEEDTTDDSPNALEAGEADSVDKQTEDQTEILTADTDGEDASADMPRSDSDPESAPPPEPVQIPAPDETETAEKENDEPEPEAPEDE